MDIELELKQSLQAALQTTVNITLPLATVDIQPTRKEFEGDYTFITFSLASICQLVPAVIAEKVGRWLKQETSLVKSYNVVQGFLNISLQDHCWLGSFQQLYSKEQPANYPSNGKKVVIEFSSPNTNKPLHLGHLRNNFLGHSLSKMLQAAGYEVYKVNLINDRGIHICKSMVAYQQWGQGKTPESTGLKGDHLVGKYYVLFEQAYKEEVASLVRKDVDPSKAAQEAPIMQAAKKMLQQWEADDPSVRALWQQMNSWVYAGFEATYEQIGIQFDKIYYESETYLLGKQVLAEGLSKGVFYQEPDGSIWIDLQSEGLDKKLLLRSDETAVYITQDLGTADLRYHDFKPNQLVYIVGNEQAYHFAVLMKILQRLKRPYATHCYHLSYGMVDLPSGKMKSREGTVVDADNLIEQMVEMAETHTRLLGKIDNFSAEESKKLYHALAMGALKYFLLRVDAKKRLRFDPQASIDFQGDTGPFIQYTYARIMTLIQKSEQAGILLQDKSIDTATLLHPLEKSLIMQLSSNPKKLQEAVTTYSPHIMAQQVLDIAKAYNRIYAELPILHEPNLGRQLNRLHLSVLTANNIAWIMNLLGIEVLTKM
jgi:arginyl-tRNA synthetase